MSACWALPRSSSEPDSSKCPQNLDSFSILEFEMNIRIRHATPADAPGVARVQVDSWRTTYPGIVSEEFLSSLSYTESQSSWDDGIRLRRPGRSIRVAETDSKGVVGFCACGPESEGNSDYKGEIYAIYLLDDFQRLGIGRRLFLASCKSLLDSGIRSMLLWVFEDNQGARRFYESLGGEVIRRKEINIGGADLVEVAYGWKDITSLVR